MTDRLHSLRSGWVVALLLLPLQIFAQLTYDLAWWQMQPGNYSGITPIGDERYAIVSDQEKNSGFFVWQIEMDSLTGQIRNVVNEGFRSANDSIDLDAEGIAFCAETGTLFVSRESDQRIVEHNLDGSLTGRELAIPEWADRNHIRSNRGFEALGYDPERKLLWTTTESPLKEDSALMLRFMAFDSELQLQSTFPYQLDPEQAPNHGRDHYHGVVAITPYQDGLLVLERECRIAPNYSGSRCWCKLFYFLPEAGTKQLLDVWQTDFNILNVTMANYEGMCLGPKLSNGLQTVLLISDSQAGFGIGLWHLRDFLRVTAVPDMSQETPEQPDDQTTE